MKVNLHMEARLILVAMEGYTTMKVVLLGLSNNKVTPLTSIEKARLSKYQLRRNRDKFLNFKIQY